jgi:hypothetical protein
MEHSGTTYVNKIINSHSEIFSGFECGILLGNLQKFEEVKSFSNLLSGHSFHFGLPQDYIKHIKKCNYDNIYDYIQNNKGSFYKDSKIQNLIKKSKYFSDKTPCYIYTLENIYNKIAHLKIPIIITLKSYDEIYKSWCIKRNLGVNCFHNHISKCVSSLKWIKINRPTNIHLFVFDDILNNETMFSKQVFKILKTFEPELNTEELSINKFTKKTENVKFPYDDYIHQKSDLTTEILDSNIKDEYNTLIKDLKITL